MQVIDYLEAGVKNAAGEGITNKAVKEKIRDKWNNDRLKLRNQIKNP